MFRYLYLVPILFLFYCEKGEPVIEQDAILLISASPSTIYNFGDTSIITVQAVEADGRPVLDGTSLQFTSTGGSIIPSATTKDGQAKVVFTSDAQVADVTVTVQSGSIGADGSVSTVISIQDRNIAIGNTVMGLNPSNVNQAGGQVEVILTVLDAAGLPIPHKPVVFSSDYGVLSSNGLARTTNASGQAFDTLQLQTIPSGMESIGLKALVGTQTVEANLTVSQNQNPISLFTSSPESVQAGDMIYFNGSESSDPDGRISNWEWSFGDGQLAVGETVSHSYQQAGVYKVTLKVTDSQGSQVSSSQSITVGNNEIPTADFTYSPANPRVYDFVLFNGQLSTDPDGEIVSYQWRFLSGITREGPTVSYAFAGAGSYVVSLTVTDDSGGKHTVSKTITVEGNQTPIADFIFSPTNPRVAQRITFDGSISSDPDGTISSYQWNFGNGSTAEGASRITSYGKQGTYQVQLTVRDDDGGLGFKQKNITVNGNDAPQASFSYTPAAPKLNERVSFDGTASSDQDGYLISHKWNFGDGATGSGPTASHIYLTPGSYQVALTVKDNDGGTDVATETVIVDRGGIPQAELNLVPQTIAPPEGQVLLDASSSSDAEDALGDLRFTIAAFAPSHVQIEIPDGYGPVREASLSDLQLGDQVIFVLTVRDQDGNEATDSKVLTASVGETNQSPNAVFTVNPASLQEPGGNVILDATETTDPDHPSSSLTYEFAAQTSGNVIVNLDSTQTGPVQTATISQAVEGDVVAFLLTVTDPLDAQGWHTESVIITAAASNHAPTAAMAMNIPPQVSVNSFTNGTLEITLDGTNTQDQEDTLEQLKWNYTGSSSSETVSVVITPFEPGKAQAVVSGLQAGDQVNMILTVTDTGQLDDSAVLWFEITE